MSVLISELVSRLAPYLDGVVEGVEERLALLALLPGPAVPLRVVEPTDGPVPV